MAETRLRKLRRIAREAQGTYVGRHWPTMAEFRRDGIGYGLVEDAANERFIRRYLAEFQPELVLQMLDDWEAALATPSPSEPLCTCGHLRHVPGECPVPDCGCMWGRPPEIDVDRLREALDRSIGIVGGRVASEWADAIAAAYARLADPTP